MVSPQHIKHLHLSVPLHPILSHQLISCSLFLCPFVASSISLLCPCSVALFHFSATPDFCSVSLSYSYISSTWFLPCFHKSTLFSIPHLFSNTFTHPQRCHQDHLTSHFYLLEWPLNFILTNLCFFLICYGHLFDTWSWLKTLNCSLVCAYDLINHKTTMDGFMGITQSRWNGMPDVVYLVKSMLWKRGRSPSYIRKQRLDCVLLLEYLLRLPLCFSCYESTDCISRRHGKIFFGEILQVMLGPSWWFASRLDVWCSCGSLSEVCFISVPPESEVWPWPRQSL